MKRKRKENVHVHTHTHTHARTSARKHAHINTHTHTHTYTHTHNELKLKTTEKLHEEQAAIIKAEQQQYSLLFSSNALFQEAETKLSNAIKMVE